MPDIAAEHHLEHCLRRRRAHRPPEGVLQPRGVALVVGRTRGEDGDSSHVLAPVALDASFQFVDGLSRSSPFAEWRCRVTGGRVDEDQRRHPAREGRSHQRDNEATLCNPKQRCPT